jgi:hypothetical protein
LTAFGTTGRCSTSTALRMPAIRRPSRITAPSLDLRESAWRRRIPNRAGWARTQTLNSAW